MPHEPFFIYSALNYLGLIFLALAGICLVFGSVWDWCRDTFG